MTGTPAWVATEATVTTCRYQFARLNTVTLGIRTAENFRITFDYYAHGQLHSSEFHSPTAIPQNTRLPLTYNPLHPEENSLASGPNARPTRGPLLAIGIAGSLLLSLLWLSVVRGCS